MQYKLKIIVAFSIFSSIIFPLYADITVKIPQSIDLKKEDFSGLRDVTALVQEKDIEILIYSYSTGPVSFSYDGNDTISEKLSRGWIKAAVKQKRKGKLSEVIFLEAAGSSKEELLQEIVKKIKWAVKKL